MRSAVIASAAACGLVLATTSLAAGQDEARWLLELSAGAQRVAVDPVTGRRRPRPDRRPDGPVSPDGTKVAYIGPGHGGPELFVADAGGANARQRTNGARQPRQPQWLPNGREVVYVRGTGDHTQVYRTDVTAEKWSETRVSRGKKQSWLPRVAPDGRVAYLELEERRSKGQLVSLVVVDGRERRSVVERETISAFAWSPDGGRIAFSTDGALVVLDPATGDRTTRLFSAMDERLYAHHARSLAWRPDGKVIAALIKFSGGVVLEPGKTPKPVPGDREVFLIPLDGEATWHEVPGPWTEVAWFEAPADR